MDPDPGGRAGVRAPGEAPGGTAADPVLAPASARTTREVAGFIEREGGRPWHPAPEAADQPCPFDGVLALAGGEIAGCLLGHAVPSLAPESDAMYPILVVAAAWRRRRVGTRLVEALAAVERARPTWVFVHVEDPDPVGPAFLASAGFGSAAELIMYTQDTPADPPPVAPGPWTFAEYRGGHPGRDAAIADLHARGYRGSPSIPHLTAAAVAAQAASPDLTFLLALEGERVVAFALLSLSDDTIYIDSFVVARSQWGTGLSDALHDRVILQARAAGCRRITAIVARTNHAIRRAERRGMRVTGRVRRFGRRLGPSAAPAGPHP